MGRKARDKKSRPPSATAATASLPRSIAESIPADKDRTAAVPAACPPLLPKHAWKWLVALFAAAAVAYAGGIHTPFLLDDPINITKNPNLPRALNFYTLSADPRAVVTMSLHWNYLTGGFSVAGYHALNVFAHTATGCMVFAFAWATLRLPVFAGRYVPHAESLAGVIALIFLLHPMQTESVTYVIQRAEIFVSAGLLGALLAMLAMKDEVTPRAMMLLVGSCVFGVYSKPSFVVVPALLLVQDACLLAREKPTGVWKRWPAYVVTTAAAVGAFALTKVTGGFESDTAGFDVEGIRPLDYLSAQFGVVVQYLRVALWPHHLCFDCGYRGAWPVVSTFLGDSVALPAAILAVAGLASLAMWRRQPLVTFAGLACIVVLSPTSSFVPLADFYVEHRMYLPIAFLAMALVPIAHDAIGALCLRAGAAPGSASIARRVVAAVVIASLAMLTMSRNALLADPVALMEDALAQAPQNERVHFNLANAYKRLGRFDDAIPHYETAIRLIPGVMRSYENLGSLYLEQGKPDDALRIFLAGAAAKPDVGMVHRNVATTYLRLGKPAEALAAAQRSLEVEPGNANGHRLAGDALLQLGRRTEAAEKWRAGLVATPRDSALTERLASLERH